MAHPCLVRNPAIALITISCQRKEKQLDYFKILERHRSLVMGQPAEWGLASQFQLSVR